MPEALNYRFRVRRGITAAVAADVPLDGELLLDKTTRTITVGDGLTAGGLAIHRATVGLGNVTNDLQLKASQLDDDGALAANSATRVPSQRAVRAYVAAHAGSGEGSGGTVLDTTGLEHWWHLPWYKSQSSSAVTLVETGSPGMHGGQVLGKFATVFSGSGQYFTLPSSASTQVGAGSFSVACWARPAATSAAGLMSKWDYSDNQREWLLNMSGGRVQFNLRNSANTGIGGQVIQPGTLVAYEWVHVVGVYDASAATIALYVNTVRTAGAVTGGTRNGTSRLLVGASGVSSAAVESIFTGRMAEVSIWHRALSDAEVGTLYNSGAGATLPFVAP